MGMPRLTPALFGHIHLFIIAFQSGLFIHAVYFPVNEDSAMYVLRLSNIIRSDMTSKLKGTKLNHVCKCIFKARAGFILHGLLKLQKGQGFAVIA